MRKISLISGADAIPVELLEAQKENKLVIFAGAGISKSSGGYDFKELAEELSQYTSYKQEDYEPIENFLGRLSDSYKENNSRPFKLYEQTAEKFNSLESNELHHQIVKLFEGQEIRIITTNFDNCLSQALDGLNNTNKKLYYAPAMPLGDDFEGLAYLHGCIEDNCKKFILTDVDFGKAYITRYWASKFLIDIFNNYTVLFIGYSYNDTVLKYLARAIVDNDTNIYALVEEGHETSWEQLGINRISYENHDSSHSNLVEFLKEWNKRIHTNISEEKQYIKELSEKSPKLLSPEEVDYIRHYLFQDPAKAQSFVKIANSNVEWFEWLYNKDFLSFLVNDSNYSFVENTLASWIIENFIRKEELYLGLNIAEDKEESILFKILKDPYKVNINFLDLTLRSFWLDLPNSKIFSHWLPSILINMQKYPNRNYYLGLELKDINKSGYKDIAISLFNKMISSSFENDYLSLRNITINCDDYDLSEFWGKNLKPNLSTLSEDLLSLLKSKIIEAGILYNAWHHNKNANFLLCCNRTAIETHKEDKHFSNFDLIINFLRDIVDFLTSNNNDKLIEIINWINIDNILLKRFALYSLAKYKAMSSNQKIKWILKQNILHEIYLKYEVRKLLQQEYGSLSINYKRQLIKAIKGYIKDREEKELSKNYYIYYFLGCIYDENKDCELIKEAYEDFSSKVPEKDREPWVGLQISHSWSCSGLQSKTPLTEEELLEKDLNNSKVIEELCSIKDKEPRFEQNTREAFLQTVKELASKNTNWGLKLAKGLIKYSKKDTDLWKSVFNISKADLTQSDFNKIIDFLDKNISHINIEQIKYYITDYIIELLNINNVEIIGHADKVFNVIKYIWANLEEQDSSILSGADPLSHAINHPCGRLTEAINSLIWIEYKDDKDKFEKTFDEKYAKFFNKEILDSETKNSNMGKAVLSTQASFFHYVKPIWTEQKLLEIFKWDNETNAYIAWSSFLQCGRIKNDAFIRVIKHYFEESFEYLEKKLEKKIGKFCEYYALILFDSIIFDVGYDNEFQVEKLLNNLSAQNVKNWASAIKKQLSYTNKENKAKIWDSWLKDFWRSRILNYSYLEELNSLLNIIPELADFYNEAISIAMGSDKYNEVPARLFCKLENKDIHKQYPQKTIELIHYLLNCNEISELIDGRGLHSLNNIIKELLDKNKEFQNDKKVKDILHILCQKGYTWAGNFI